MNEETPTIEVDESQNIIITVQPPTPATPPPIVTVTKLNDLLEKRTGLASQKATYEITCQAEKDEIDSKYNLLLEENRKANELNEFAIEKAIEQGATL